MSHRIDITENGTTTLLTEGKYCDRNIDINVNVESSGGTEIEDALISGTLSGAYRNDRVTTIRNYAIYMMNVTSVDMPNVTSVGERAVYACKQLTSVNMPLVETIGTMAFYADTVLVEIDFPRLKSVPQRAFADCLGLMTANLPSVTSIGTSAFSNSGLNALILRSNTVCTLSNTNAFTATGISRGTGFVYVPDNLLEEYRQATNWATLESQIKPLSELEE